MPILNRLLDDAKSARKLSSDLALAEALKVSRSAVSLWRKGGRIQEEHLTALISLAGADPASAVQVMADQARTRQERAVWGAVLDRLRPAAAVAGIALIGYLVGDADTLALAFAPIGTMHYANFAVALIAGFFAWQMLRRPAGSVGNRCATVGTSPGTRMDNAPSLAAA